MTPKFRFATLPYVPVHPEEDTRMRCQVGHVGNSVVPVLNLAQLTGAHLHARVADGQLHLCLRLFALLPLVVAPEYVERRLDALVTLGPTGWHIAQVDNLVVEITSA